jgi:hypothetical protein
LLGERLHFHEKKSFPQTPFQGKRIFIERLLVMPVFLGEDPGGLSFRGKEGPPGFVFVLKYRLEAV